MIEGADVVIDTQKEVAFDRSPHDGDPTGSLGAAPLPVVRVLSCEMCVVYVVVDLRNIAHSFSSMRQPSLLLGAFSFSRRTTLTVTSACMVFEDKAIHA